MRISLKCKSLNANVWVDNLIKQHRIWNRDWRKLHNRQIDQTQGNDTSKYKKTSNLIVNKNGSILRHIRRCTIVHTHSRFPRGKTCLILHISTFQWVIYVLNHVLFINKWCMYLAILTIKIKPPLKLGHGWEIAYRCTRMYSLSHHVISGCCFRKSFQ